MKYFTLLFLSAILFVACEEKKAVNTDTEIRTEEVEKEAEVAFEKFGKEITPDNVIETKELMAKLETEDSVYAKIKTTVSSVCKKKGCWMSVPLNDETEMRVRFKDYEFFVPLNCEGKNAIIEGWAYKYITPVEELQHYAFDAGNSQEEIDAITEPETGYTFMADGVLMN